jgi:hypothetical protein
MSKFSSMCLREGKLGAKSRLRGHIRCQPVGGGSTLFRAKIRFRLSEIEPDGKVDPVIRLVFTNIH